MLLLNKLCALLVCYRLAAAQAVGSVQPQVTSRRYIETERSVLLNATVSSDVINETNLPSKFDCLTMCQTRGCSVVVVMEMSRICQLVIVNDASQALGPPGSHVRRLVGSEAGARVWKVEEFEDLLRMREFNLSIVLNYTGIGRNGSIQQAVINVTGCYRIEVAGARGGDNNYTIQFGDKGATAAGSFNLTAGTQLVIVVGQMGGPANAEKAGAGGGGGSFVYRTADSHLLMAAGGGGGASYSRNGNPGKAAVGGGDSSGNAVNTGFGGINGQPGSNNPSATPANHNHGGCGAGWLGKAVNPRRSSSDGERGGGLADGWVGGSAGDGNTGDGGFGGGGGGGAASHGAAGAGGGFSGGGADVFYSHAGGGGGSYCSGSGCTATTGGNADSDHGLVVLRLLAPFADTCE